MIRLVCIFACVLFAKPALAQTVTVRSGEHQGFTRLTLDLPVETTWRLVDQDSRALIRVPGLQFQYDLSTVFDRIGRNRVAEVRATSDGLMIGLACDCVFETFTTSNGLAVIDILDKPAPEQSDAWRTSLRTRVFGGYRFAEFNPAQVDHRTPTVDRPKANLFASQSLPIRSPERSKVFPGQAFLPGIDPMLIEDLATRRADEATTEQRLLEQLGRASEQGLVSFRSFDTASAENDSEVDTSNTNDTVIRRPLTNLRTHSSLHAERDEPIAKLDASHTGVACTPDRQIAIASWVSQDTFDAEIARHRSALYGEFDRANPDSALALARAYLYFGFAAEARQIVSLFRMDEQDSVVLRSLAAILEPSSPFTSNLFLGQETCRSDTALWGVLSADNDDVVRRSDSATVLRAFARLPKHLQSQLGPDLAERYANAGDLTSADALARMIARIPSGIGGEPSFGLAVQAAATGDASIQQQLQQTMLETNAADAPKVLIDQVEAVWRDRRAPDPGIIDLLASYRLEYRGSIHEQPLLQANLRALTLLGEYDAALRLHREIEAGALADQAFRELISGVASNASDFDMVRFVFAFSSAQRELLEPSTRVRLFERLQSLGFSEEAALYSEVMPSQSRPPVSSGMVSSGIASAEQADALAVTADGGGNPPPGSVTPGSTRTANSDAGLTSDATVVSGTVIDNADAEGLAKARALLEASKNTRAEIAALMAASDVSSDEDG